MGVLSSNRPFFLLQLILLLHLYLFELIPALLLTSIVVYRHLVLHPASALHRGTHFRTNSKPHTHYIRKILYKMAKGSCMCGEVHYEYTVSYLDLHLPISILTPSSGRARSNSPLPLHRLPKMDRRSLHLQRRRPTQKLQRHKGQAQRLRCHWCFRKNQQALVLLNLRFLSVY